MEKGIKHFERELVAIRTGRASIAMLDEIRVECYGQFMGLKEVASLSAPDARLLTIQPWDKAVIGPIEKAIQMSDLGLSPINDGTVIRLQLPIMSAERREELAKVLKKRAEECRVSVRNVRREFHNQVRDAQKDKEISEDFAKRLEDELQKVTDSFIEKANSLQAKKETDLKLI
ncbi:ribosome recycling factor [bacterium]|nr:ribosome recycling factor [bacterium]